MWVFANFLFIFIRYKVWAIHEKCKSSCKRNCKQTVIVENMNKDPTWMFPFLSINSDGKLLPVEDAANWSFPFFLKKQTQHCQWQNKPPTEFSFRQSSPAVKKNK